MPLWRAQRHSQTPPQPHSTESQGGKILVPHHAVFRGYCMGKLMVHYEKYTNEELGLWSRDLSMRLMPIRSDLYLQIYLTKSPKKLKLGLYVTSKGKAHKLLRILIPRGR